MNALHNMHDAFETAARNSRTTVLVEQLPLSNNKETMADVVHQYKRLSNEFHSEI